MYNEQTQAAAERLARAEARIEDMARDHAEFKDKISERLDRFEERTQTTLSDMGKKLERILTIGSVIFTVVTLLLQVVPGMLH